jgi:hypothetical protein
LRGSGVLGFNAARRADRIEVDRQPALRRQPHFGPVDKGHERREAGTAIVIDEIGDQDLAGRVERQIPFRERASIDWIGYRADSAADAIARQTWGRLAGQEQAGLVALERR